MSATANVRRNVRWRRTEQQLTLEGLAARLTDAGHPLSLKVLSKIETGHRGISVDDLAGLAVALGATTSALLMPPEASYLVIERPTK